MRNLSMRALCAFGCTLAAAAFADGPNRPFPQHTTYSSGTIKPSHRTQAQLDDDVRAAYDRWKTNYLLQAGTEPDGRARYRVSAGVIQATDTVSEGQGYGMVIVPLMAGYDPDAQTIFDGLWEYFNDHRSNVDGRLMDWHIPPSEASDDASTGDDSAFDGDADRLGVFARRALFITTLGRGAFDSRHPFFRMREIADQRPHRFRRRTNLDGIAMLFARRTMRISQSHP